MFREKKKCQWAQWGKAPANHRSWKICGPLSAEEDWDLIWTRRECFRRKRRTLPRWILEFYLSVCLFQLEEKNINIPWRPFEPDQKQTACYSGGGEARSRKRASRDSHVAVLWCQSSLLHTQRDPAVSCVGMKCAQSCLGKTRRTSQWHPEDSYQTLKMLLWGCASGATGGFDSCFRFLRSSTTVKDKERNGVRAPVRFVHFKCM